MPKRCFNSRAKEKLAMALSPSSSYYDVLKVQKKDDFDTIKSSYHRLVRRYHPDKRAQRKEQAEQEEEEFLLIQKAWECLRNKETRMDYDLLLQQQQLQQLAKSYYNNGDINNSSSIFVASNNDDAGEEEEWVEDEETGRLVYCFSCRCGEEVFLERITEEEEEEEEVLQNDNDNNDNENNKLYCGSCDGCSLKFHTFYSE